MVKYTYTWTRERRAISCDTPDLAGDIGLLPTARDHYPEYPVYHDNMESNALVIFAAAFCIFIIKFSDTGQAIVLDEESGDSSKRFLMKHELISSD